MANHTCDYYMKPEDDENHDCGAPAAQAIPAAFGSGPPRDFYACSDRHMRLLEADLIAAGFTIDDPRYL